MSGAMLRAATYTIIPDHMPLSHRFYAEWNPARFIQWAGNTGESTARLVEEILSTRPYPEQGYKTCLGIINLTRNYDPPCVEAAVRRALKCKTCSYRSMKAIRASGLDRQSDKPTDQDCCRTKHRNTGVSQSTKDHYPPQCPDQRPHRNR